MLTATRPNLLLPIVFRLLLEGQMPARQFRPHYVLIPSIAAAVCLSAAAASATDNWPRFRGLNAGAIPDNAELPERWSATENVAWKMDVPVGKNSLGEMIIATPAIVRNSLIVRTVGRVYRIADVSKPSKSK